MAAVANVEAQPFGGPLSPLTAGLPSPTRVNVVQPGSKVPDFTLADLDGNPRRFSSLAGHPVIVNFWATWCTPCRAEMPLLQSFYEEHKDDGLLLLGIDVDEPVALVQRFLDATRITYPVWLDPLGTDSPSSASMDLFRTFGGIGLPTTLFVDERGILRNTHVGEIDRKALEEQYRELRKAKADG